LGDVGFVFQLIKPQALFEKEIITTVYNEENFTYSGYLTVTLENNSQNLRYVFWDTDGYAKNGNSCIKNIFGNIYSDVCNRFYNITNNEITNTLNNNNPLITGNTNTSNGQNTNLLITNNTIKDDSTCEESVRKHYLFSEDTAINCYKCDETYSICKFPPAKYQDV